LRFDWHDKDYHREGRRWPSERQHARCYPVASVAAELLALTPTGAAWVKATTYTTVETIPVTLGSFSWGGVGRRSDRSRRSHPECVSLDDKTQRRHSGRQGLQGLREQLSLPLRLRGACVCAHSECVTGARLLRQALPARLLFGASTSSAAARNGATPASGIPKMRAAAADNPNHVFSTAGLGSPECGVVYNSTAQCQVAVPVPDREVLVSFDSGSF
jgi:hypothetical protein